MNQRKKIALIFAMEAEAKPLIESLKLERDFEFGDPHLPFEHYRGIFGSQLELLLSVSGKDNRYGVDNIGTEPATLNAYLTFYHFRPHLCINAGTAGGFKKYGAQIGDTYFSTDAFRFHDRRMPLPGFDTYGIGNYPTLLLPSMVRSLGLKEGVVTTGNSLDCTDADLKMMKKNKGVVKEMEAAAVAWVAYLLKTPMIALKSITDLIDNEDSSTAEQFKSNLKLASETLTIKVFEVLEYLASNPNEWTSNP